MLEELKSYLKITWIEEDLLLYNLIDEGKAYLNDITGVELDFETDITNKSLLKDYVRYSYNNQIEYFEENFASKLLRLQLNVACKRGN